MSQHGGGLGQLGSGLMHELSWLSSPVSAPWTSFHATQSCHCDGGVLGHSLVKTQLLLLSLSPPSFTSHTTNAS